MRWRRRQPDETASDVPGSEDAAGTDDEEQWTVPTAATATAIAPTEPGPPEPGLRAPGLPDPGMPEPGWPDPDLPPVIPNLPDVPVEPPPQPDLPGPGPVEFPPADEPAEYPPPSPTIDAGLTRTRGGFMSRLRGVLGRTADDPEAWDEVEETLIAGDVGAALAAAVVERARSRRDPAGPEAAVRAELAAHLVPRDPEWQLDGHPAGQPAVVLVVGVNGTGKTTTIGKLAALERQAGRRVVLAAADTFRAAAVDQLRIWAERADAEVVAHASGADPGAVVYDALDAAVARGADIVIADTAGRLHTKTNLMDELSKIRRIVDKRLPGARPETLFILDGTTGQNGLAQARAFHDAVELTGIVLTKLDSTAKGGIVFAIERELGVPVRYVGVGERSADLLPFDPEAFVAALFS